MAKKNETGTALALPLTKAAIAKIDETVREASLQQIANYGNFEAALTMAAGIQAIEGLLTPEVMAPVMRLQNTAIGFRTDRDPATSSQARPYSEAVVKRCLIEAVLRGVRPVGNEFNIISGATYITKNGFARLVAELPGVSDLVLTPSVPRGAGEGKALVDYRASWKVDGQPFEMVRGGDTAIGVRVNKGMGVDGIVGKATRKILSQIYGQLIGAANAVPEGEVEGAIEGEFKTTPAAKVEQSSLGDGSKAARRSKPASSEMF